MEVFDFKVLCLVFNYNDIVYIVDYRQSSIRFCSESLYRVVVFLLDQYLLLSVEMFGEIFRILLFILNLLIIFYVVVDNNFFFL